MKVLVFAHVPPPHHGQSYMVQLMLNGFGGDQRRAAVRKDSPNAYGILCYHVDARVSRTLEDIGDFRAGKFLLLLGYCAQAIWYHFRYGVDTFYYVPAPGKKSALYRDWLVMFLCRPFFKHVVLHWHAAGLGKWLETVVRIRTRSATYRLMKSVDLSIVLSNYNRADAEKLFPQKTRVVGNGIPDPFPQFDRDVLPRRQARFQARQQLLAGTQPSAELTQRAGDDPHVFHILFLAHCMTDKGLFDAITGVRLAAERLKTQRSPVTIHLSIAGNFVTPNERAQFDAIQNEPGVAEIIRYVGFVSGDEKQRLLRESDLLCFPTFYANENQPVNLIEAMAFGLPIVTTRWRSLPEMFPSDYPGLVSPHAPEEIADAIQKLLVNDTSVTLREVFMRDFRLESYLTALADAFCGISVKNS